MEPKLNSPYANPNQPSKSKSMVGMILGLVLAGLLLVGYQWFNTAMAPKPYIPGTVAVDGVYTNQHFGLQYTPPYPVWLLLDESHVEATKELLASQPGSEELLAALEQEDPGGSEYRYMDERGANLLVRVGGASENGLEAFVHESWSLLAENMSHTAELLGEPYQVTVAGLPGWGMDSRVKSGGPLAPVEQQVYMVEKDGMLIIMTLTTASGGTVEDLRPYWEGFVPLP